MKTSQDYICQVLTAHRLMLNRFYGVAAYGIRANSKTATVKKFTTHSFMLHIAYDMILRGEY